MCESLTKIKRFGYYIGKRVKDGVSLTTVFGAIIIITTKKLSNEAKQIRVEPWVFTRP